jgi:APA family basic amino acid/polyamine antiporter
MKKIAFPAALFLTTASMLGSGILTTTGSILNMVRSPNAVLLVWLIAGIHALLGALCYGAIVRRLPDSGGEATILRTFFNAPLGELAGWVSFIVGFAASNAVSAIGFASYLAKAVPQTAPHAGLAAASAILVVSALHSLAGPAGMRIQTAMAAAKFLLLGSLAIFGLFHAAPTPQSINPTFAAPLAFGPTWGTAIMFAMFAYLGWSAAIYSAGETEKASTSVPKAMAIGTTIVMALYLTINHVLLKHIPLESLAESRAVVELLVRQLFGDHTATVFASVVAFALLSSLGASAFLGPRVLNTMLRWYRKAPHPQGPVSVPPGVVWLQEQEDGSYSPPQPVSVPPWVVWLQGGLTIGLILTGTFGQILTFTGFLLGVFPMLSVIGLYTKTASQTEPVHPAIRYLAAPIFLLGSALILILSIMDSPSLTLGALALVVIALTVRLRFKGQLQ